MRRHSLTRVIATAAGALALAAGVATAAVASPANHASQSPASQSPASQSPASQQPQNSPLVAAFEQLSQDNTWTLSKTIPQTWVPAGEDWEQEGFKYYNGRFYISVYDHTNNDGHLVILDSSGNLIKVITFVDGQRQHAGGMDVYGDYAYVPLAVDAPHSSADILRINVNTYQVTKLFTVDYDHVGGVTYDPALNVIVGQDWDSRHFYEWTMSGKIVAQWNNPTDYVGYQDCQYVVYNKLLCSGATEGATTIGGFDLIDLSDPDHAILNGVPNANAGNAGEIFASSVPHGTELTEYDAGNGPIQEYTTTIWDKDYQPPYLSLPEGTPALDDQADAVWDNTPAIPISSSSSPISATVRLLWDDQYLYFLVDVSDSTPNAEDSVDFWINWKNSPWADYYVHSGDIAAHYNVTRDGVVSSDFPYPLGTGDVATVKSAVTSTSTGYVVEAAIPWPRSVKPQPEIGVNVSVNDYTTPGGPRTSYITPYSGSSYWEDPASLPTVALVS